ncbi:TRAP transporter small permease subunit [Sedimentitalea sp.]|uniref:TRAP transporter small permease n=2 Tax=Sedimentitalea sp. TaxID=2048915 RepID=UPI003266B2F0
MRSIAIMLHNFAEKLSFVGALVAVVAFVIMPVLVAGQVLGRTFGFSVAGAPEYASYCFATVAFMGLAYAMKEYSHVRVSFLLEGPMALRRSTEIVAHVFGTVLSGFATYVSWTGVGFSLKFNDISQGHDATPLWIPQSVMIVGFGMLFLMIFSRLMLLLFARDVPLGAAKSIMDEGH